MTALSPLSAAASPVQTERARLSAAARQFEAIFVRQMLAAARKSDFGETLFGSQAVDTFRQLQDERFADVAAESGAFGLARLIEARLQSGLSAQGDN